MNKNYQAKKTLTFCQEYLKNKKPKMKSRTTQSTTQNHFDI